jgi:hypothetical protein
MSQKEDLLKEAIMLDKAKKRIEHKLAMVKTELATMIDGNKYENDGKYIEVKHSKRFKKFHPDAFNFVPDDVLKDVVVLDRKKVETAVKDGVIDAEINKFIERQDVTAIYIGEIKKEQADV